MQKKIIIAVDGYSSCGKSTLARDLAAKLDYTYIDSGAMYRAAAFYFSQHSIDVEQFRNLDNAGQNKILDSISIEFRKVNDGIQEIFLNGKNVSHEIRLPAVSDKVSPVSAIPLLREKMVTMQRNFGKEKEVVMDGRDIGTKVFPEAELKIFMTADIDIRAKRRFDELKAKGISVSLDEVKKNIESRDYEDTHRVVSPLVKADDAIILDNSHLNRQQQLEAAMKMVNERFTS
jgi:CMP/dCMP kinase